MANKLTSIIPSGSNNYLTPSLSFNRIPTDTISPGVIGAIGNTAGIAPSTGGYAVNAQGSPNMTVTVTGPGAAYVSAIPTGGVAQTLGVTIDATENVTISSNSSGSTVYDFLSLYLDPNKMNTPASTGLDVATFVTSRSTTPYNAVGANFGNSNGAQVNTLLLGVVTVVNGATSIVNANITDARVQAKELLPAGPGTVSAATALTNPYKFRVHLVAAQNSVNGSTRILYDTKDFDTSSNVDIVTNKGRFTAPIAGFYWFSANVTLSAGSYSNVSLAKNGTAISTGSQAVDTGINGVAIVSDIVQLAAGDYVEAFVNNNGANALNVGVAGNNFFSGFLVSTL